MLQGVWKERVTQLQGGVKESPLPHQLWHRNFSFLHRAGEETHPLPTWIGLMAGCFSSIILSPSS